MQDDSPTFEPFSRHPRGTMVTLLRSGYSFEPRYERDWLTAWEQADAFFYDHLPIADRCGFVTTLAGLPVGFICWDPRACPDRIEVGHNCIAADFKGRGLGKAQLAEAVNRMLALHPRKITVTTDTLLLPAQRNYEDAGFRLVGTRENPWNQAYAGRLMDYERP